MDDHNQKVQEQLIAHAARNQALAATISGYGIPLDHERLVDINFWSPDEPTARGLAEALVRNEFANVRATPGITKWSVTGQMRASVKTMVESEMTELLIRLADKYGSVYDGWGTALVELAGNS